MSNSRYWFFGGVLVLVMLVWWPILGGRGQITPVRDDEVPLLHFIDTRSGEVFPIRSRERLEKHPISGEKTLRPGAYCSKCDKWRLVPNLDNMQSSPATRNCPIHRIPMVIVRDEESLH